MCCHTKPHEEGIKKKLTETFMRNTWVVRKAKHRMNAKTAEEVITAQK